MNNSRQKLAHDAVDLSNTNTAASLINDVILQRKLNEINQTLSSFVEKLKDSEQAFAKTLIEILAQISTQVEVLSQAQTVSSQTRAQKMQSDPLPFISRADEAHTPLTRGEFELELEEPLFSGIGWYEVQGGDEYAWRWSNANGYSALVLPTLGGGRLRFSAKFILPFAANVHSDYIGFSVQEQKVEVLTVSSNGREHVFDCELELPMDNGLGQFVLLVGIDDRAEAQAGSPAELRQLGAGLKSFRLYQI